MQSTLRRSFLFGVLFSAFMPAALAQTGVSCTAFVANQPVLRQEGTTEPAGDILINCSGALLGAQTGPQTISLFVNGAPITSRQLYTGSAPASIPTEAAVLVNDCTSNSGVSPNGSGFSCAPNGTFTGGNPTQGFLQNGALTFSGFTLPVVANSGQFQIRITNVRVYVNSLAAGSYVTSTVLATFGIQNQQGLVMGVVEPSLSVSVSTPISSFPQCGSQSDTITNLTIKELVNTAFKSPASAAANSTPGDWYQNNVNSESQTVLTSTSGWTNQRNAIPGQADAGTRIRVSVSNIPANVTVTMPFSVTNVVGGSLVYNPGGDIGPFLTGLGSGIPITSFGSVTYEVRAQNPSASDSFNLPIIVSTSGNPGAGTILISVTYAATAAESTSQIPLFADTSVLTPVFSVNSCLPATHLAFTAPPANGIAGVALPTVILELLDAFNNVTLANELVTVTSSPAAVSTAVTSADGVASFNNLVFGSPGTYTLTATTLGLAGIVSGPFTIKEPSTVTVSASPNPARFGQSVTLTAVVSPAAATGEVTFYDGTTVLGTSTLSGGQAQLTTTLLASGPRTIKARYIGNPTYVASLSAPLTATINTVTGNGFQSPLSYAAGVGAYAMAVSDVNGDGIADLIVADYAANTVSVLLGNGNGSFQTPANYSSGNLPSAVVVADFNGDGKPDLAVANQADGTVSIFFGKSGGGFQLQPLVAAGSSPVSLAVGDFNGDGFADLAVVSDNNGVNVLLGNGDGTFQPPAGYSTGTGAFFVAVGDFNKDGNADLAVANAYGGTVSVLLGNGDGTFQPAQNYPAGANPQSIAIADLNGDGNPDLVIASSSDDDLCVLLGNDDGSFQAPVFYTAGSSPYAVATGDFNGDGRVDLAVANVNSNTVSLLLGNGNGTFQTAFNYATGINPQSLVVADFNGDGRADVATANFNGSSVGILLGATPNPTQLRFTTQPASGVTGTAISPVVVQVQDPAGNLVISSNASVTVTSFPAGVTATVSAVAGSATFNGLVFGTPGTYTLTATSPGLSTTGSIGFIVGTPVPVVVSGQVTVSNIGLGNVTISVTGTENFPTVTNASGNYSVSLAQGGNYTITATLSGYSFNGPVNLSNLTTNQAVNFTGVEIGGLDFFPVTPCRIADTRAAAGFTGQFGPPSMTGGTTRTFGILSSSCATGIPSNVAAYSLNFTVVPPAGGPAANLTTWPTGLASGMPNVSTLNYAGSVVANAAIVPAGTNGSINVFVNDPTDVLFDINGYFAPASSSGLEFYAAPPCRIADTRTGAGFSGQFGPPSLSGGATRTYNLASSSCGIPANASAYSLNFTVVPPTGGPAANLTTWPATQPIMPNVSTLNFSGSVVANAAIVPAGTNNSIDVFVNDPTNMLFDINGYFAVALPNGLHFYPVTPCRIADTRAGAGFSGQFGPPTMAGGTTRTFVIPSSACGIPGFASAYSLNFTVVPPSGGPAANLTTWPTGTAMPNVSTLNYYGSVVANAAIVPAGTNGAINVFVNLPTDVLFDINGYFAQ